MSVLSDLAVLAEQATDTYADKLNDCAAAENAYHRAYFTVIAESDPSLSNAARERFAEAECVEEKCAWTTALAAEKQAKQHITTVLARLSAAQSYYRMVEKQT